MSTAFRNFIITFALAAALFAVVAYMAVNGILDGLFNGNGNHSEDLTDYSYDKPETYFSGEYDESQSEIPTIEEFGEAYVIFYEDHQSELISAKLICVNEKSGKLVYETLPSNSTIVVNGYNRTVKEIYKTNGVEYLCGKLQYVLGVGVKSCVVFDTKAMVELFTESTLLTDYELEINCNLPYEVKYEDPEMKDYNEQNPDDIQYITLAGDAIITKENAKYIFEDVPEDAHDAKAASAMFSQIYDNVFNSLFGKKEFRDSESSVKDFFKCTEKTTLDAENYGVILGLFNGEYEVKGLSDLSAMAGKELNWSTLPIILETALK